MKEECVRIGRIILEARKARGLSQMKLAELIGISYQQVQKYEKGSDSISVDRLAQISRALAIPPADFFSGLPETVAESASVYGRRLTEDEAELLEQFKRIKSKKTRRALIDLMKSFTTNR